MQAPALPKAGKRRHASVTSYEDDSDPEVVGDDSESSYGPISEDADEDDTDFVRYTAVTGKRGTGALPGQPCLPPRKPTQLATQARLSKSGKAGSTGLVHADLRLVGTSKDRAKHHKWRKSIQEVIGTTDQGQCNVLNVQMLKVSTKAMAII